MKTKIEYNADKQHWDLFINGIWEDSFPTKEAAKRAAERIAREYFDMK